MNQRIENFDSIFLEIVENTKVKEKDTKKLNKDIEIVNIIIVDNQKNKIHRTTNFWENGISIILGIIYRVSFWRNFLILRYPKIKSIRLQVKFLK